MDQFSLQDLYFSNSGWNEEQGLYIFHILNCEVVNLAFSA